MARLLVGLLTLAAVGYAHGSTTPPPPPAEMPPPPRTGPVPVPPPPPPPPSFDPTGPTTPSPTPVPPPPVPTPKPPDQATSKRPPARKPLRERPPQSGDANSWRLWWEYNREYLIGVRGMLRRVSAVTGTDEVRRHDPLQGRRDDVLAALRKTAKRAGDRTLRAAAVIALGRMGGDDDARFIVRLLHDRRQPRDVQEAAAVALGLLPPIQDEETRAATNAYLRYATTNANVLPTRARGLALLTTGMRARHDKSLVLFLLGQIGGTKIKRSEAANLAMACGFARDPMTAPELITAASRGKLGARPLSDVGRAHATQALALIRGGDMSTLFIALLSSRNAGLDVRRAAALSLGRTLRERDLPRNVSKRAERALLRTLDKGRDPILRGFAAVAMGGARRPLGVAAMRAAIDHGGNAEIKPFCALALGLAARTRDDNKIRNFLAAELNKTKAIGLSSALSIALGIARAEKARDLLHARLRRIALPIEMRGAAAQALGLLGARSPEIVRSLERAAFASGNSQLVEDAVLALGMLGRRGIAPRLVERLRSTSSTMLQARITLALGRLDHDAAVAPLLALLKNRSARPLVREFAAVALGMMGDRREVDTLFFIDAYFNFYATTLATHELLRLY